MEWGGGGVCAGGRQDLGMIVWSYLQWGTPDRGIRTVASDKEAINILEAQDDPLVSLQHKEEYNLVVVSTC